MRGTWVMRNGRLVRKECAAALATKPAVYVISDAMAPMKHPSTGRILDSKAEFRRDTRASGCVEVGTDPAAMREGQRMNITKADIVPDVKRAIAQLRSR